MNSPLVRPRLFERSCVGTAEPQERLGVAQELSFRREYGHSLRRRLAASSPARSLARAVESLAASHRSRRSPTCPKPSCPVFEWVYLSIYLSIYLSANQPTNLTFYLLTRACHDIVSTYQSHHVLARAKSQAFSLGGTSPRGVRTERHCDRQVVAARQARHRQ